MKVIKLYAPCDGEINDITAMDDEVFSSKSLGDGFCITPSSNTFYPVFKSGTIPMIFETKHAIYFQNEDINLLMHIGIDTVKLNGQGFSTHKEVGEKFKLTDKIVDVDLKLLKNKNISSQTALVIEEDILKKYQLTKTLTSGVVKAGTLIGQLTLEADDVSLKKSALKAKIINQAASDFLKQVGGPENFSDYRNCLTRLRFTIIDKNLVDSEAISQNRLVKGLVWNGSELQIVIGSEVRKVKNAIDELMNHGSKTITNQGKTKIVWYRRLLQFVVAVVVPCLPLMFYTGLSSGVAALFQQLGWAKPGWEGLGDLDPFSAFLIINSRVGFMLLGVFFGYTTAKYFNANPILALLICLTLSSRLLFGVEWPIIANVFGERNISWKGYENSVLIYIIAVIGYAYLNRWVEKWMPDSVSNIFTPIVSVGVTISVAFFVVGPFVTLFEELLAKGVLVSLKIPFGIGPLIVAFLLQPLVLTGAHLALSTIVMQSMINTGEASIYFVCVGLAAFGQGGAVLGAAIRSKDLAFKRNAYGIFPIATFFGITEPALYAITLPKGKPFVSACTAAGIGGFIAGLLNLEMNNYTGNGVFSALGFNSIANIWIYLALGFGVVGLALVFTLLTYRERPDEFKSVVYLNKHLKNQVKENNQVTLDALNEISLTIQAKQEFINQIENNIILGQKNQEKLNKVNKTQTSSKTSITSEKNQILLTTLENQALSIKNDLDLQLKELTTCQNQWIGEINNLIDSLEFKNEKVKTKVVKKYENKIKSLNLNYGV
ncbi:glucose PTS transporter subunit IIA [Spiroplasma alleghenense]|uniref:PTS system, beta-glucoside-specific IIA component n=1 Tax=Spiroplasma alleghenense TaxID=216931 RepID=A0A345Z4Q9_9MOLU|nr:PTS glucose transporter subunit IIABC [Spiroplasma alleghenense]AXK51588.1 PTS system, beta-glucoside-specific IIA component [Spiroplasma alleghenense]